MNEWALDQMLSGKRAMNPPLGLATLAALCPPRWTVEIVDENIEALPLAPQADLRASAAWASRRRDRSNYWASTECLNKSTNPPANR